MQKTRKDEGRCYFQRSTTEILTFSEELGDCCMVQTYFLGAPFCGIYAEDASRTSSRAKRCLLLKSLDNIQRNFKIFFSRSGDLL